MKNQKMKKHTTHVILRDGRTPGTYKIWSEHRSEGAAIKRLRILGKNASEGHSVVVPVAKIEDYELHQ
jgi:hypothetical protein